MKFLYLLLPFLVLPFCLNASWNKLGSDIVNHERNGLDVIAISNDGLRVAYSDTLNDGSANAFNDVINVYEYDGYSWSQVGQAITPNFTHAVTRIEFGIDSNEIAISSYSHDTSNYTAGKIQFFKYENENWSLVNSFSGGENFERLGVHLSFNSLNNYALGNANSSSPSEVKINTSYFSGNIDDGYFRDVFLNESGSRLLVGNNLYGLEGNQANLIHSFPSTQSAWTSVSLSEDGETIAIGFPYNSTMQSNGGAFQAWKNINGSWVQLGNILYGERSEGQLGKEISMNASGNRIAVITEKTSTHFPVNGYTVAFRDKGKVFELENNTWTEKIIFDARSIKLSRDGNHVAVLRSDVYGQGGSQSIFVYTTVVQPSDSDGDGLSDEVETNTGIYVSENDTGTDPNDPDSDDDTLLDGAEIVTHLTNPNLSDSDFDGISDSLEINLYSSDPNSSDSDNDGLSDLVEANLSSVNFDINSNDSASVQTLKENGFLTVQDIQDIRSDSTMIEVSGNQATVQLQMEESSDLQTWEDTGAPATMTIPADTDTKFFRFKMAE